ncbi:MAG: glycosyltransferase family 9 protein [Flavobacteriaceae bacterium]|nr:glycosyltransferase family 9 protein [Flavobacteriaceae bacterium]
MQEIKQQHILVIRFSAMGDVAMLVPVLRVLLNENQNVKVTILSQKFLKPIFNEEIIGKEVSFYEADIKNKHKGFFGLFKLARELKKLDITAIADMHSVLRSKILCFFLFFFKIKNVSINKGRTEKKALTSTTNKVFKQLKTTHERYATVFRKLGFIINLSKHRFPKKTEKTIVSSFINILKEDEKWIGIAPFAKHIGKMYPLDLIEQVIEKLSKNNQLFLFGGGKKETFLLNNIAKKYTKVQSVAGQLSLKEELQLISNLDVMLAMDSGNAHFSAMFGVKTVTIWGATHPFAGFAPFLQHENCITPNLKKYPNLPCSIYGNKICKGYEDVMQSISIKKILNSF